MMSTILSLLVRGALMLNPILELLVLLKTVVSKGTAKAVSFLKRRIKRKGRNDRKKRKRI
jgi:hypothetical protein